MKMRPAYKLWLVAVSWAWLCAQNSLAGIQVSENFDTNWPAPWNYRTYLNATNTESGWTIQSNSIASSQPAYVTTASNACFFGRLTSGQAWLKSPLLTNGIGSVIMDAKSSSATPVILAFESSYDGISWFTNVNGLVTNASTSLSSFTNIIQSMSNQYLRIRRLDATTIDFAIDTLRITYPIPLVTFSNLTNSPARPADQDSATVSANVNIMSVPDAFALTNYWREWPATNWTAIAMTSNAPGLYTAVSAIPGKSIGTRVEYYAQATYTSDGTPYTTNSSTNAYVVIPKSSYTNLSVIGEVTTSLLNGLNYQWQGVIQVTTTNPTFNFRGISNAVTTTWGETNQTATTVPVFGQAEVASNTITLYTTNAGHYLFSFTETNRDYSVRSCVYENFNSWTGASYNANGIHTNNQWILNNGNTSNDTARIFAGTGRSAIVQTNGWVRSPELTNGVGQIALWYRNWPTNGTPTGAFQLELSPDNTNWTSQANWALTNIITTNYLFQSVGVNDLASKYIRIRNTNSAAPLCLDEVSITPPGATVVSSNLVTTPLAPTILDSISFSTHLLLYNGASLSSVTNWYRIGSTGQWVPIAMTNSGGTQYVTTTPIYGVPAGTSNLQFAVECAYSGFQASSPVFFPSGGTNNPAAVTISIPTDSRQENFDTNWPGAPWGYRTYLNATNPASGWSIQSNSIASSQPTYVTTASNACFFGRVTSGQAWLKSPLLINGIGSVILDAKSSSATPVILAFESSYDGISWFTNVNGLVTNASTSLSSFTNIVLSTSNQYWRTRRLDATTVDFAIDTLRITYPPANVAITNISITPGYPVAGQAFTIECDVASLNPLFPAYNVVPRLYYWTGGTTNSALLSRSWISGITNHYTLTQSLSNATRDTPFNYYIRVDFDGYYGSTAENRSPQRSATAYFVPRASTSPYQTIGVSVNGNLTTGRMLTSGVWQAVFTTASTNSLAFTINGLGYGTNSAFSTNTVVWGNTNNWQTTTPLAEYAATGQTAFAISSTNAFSGQYVMRFDESTAQYIILRCVSQDFDEWLSNDDLYKLESKGAAPIMRGIFDPWSTNFTQTRSENFSDLRWTNATTYSSYSAYGPVSYGIFSSRIITVSPDRAVETTNAPLIGRSFVAQGGRFSTEESTEPLKGLGTISFSYRTSVATNNTIAVYLYTNEVTDPLQYTIDSYWIPLTNSIISNTTFATYTVTLNTNLTADVIIAHISGNSSVQFDNLVINEWYADAQTNSGWMTSEAWVEQKPGAPSDLRLRFDTSRAEKGVEQSITTAMLTNGVHTLTFDCASASTNPVSLTISNRTGLFGAWTGLTNLTLSGFNGTSTDYINVSLFVGSVATNTFLKITHTTNATGVLIIDNIKVTGASVGATWEINNTAIDDTDHPVPPQALGARQFYDGFATLNSNRTSNLSPSQPPYTGTWPYIISPLLSGGAGEISFWYRNWTTSGAVSPGRLVIQTTTNSLATTNEAIWKTEAILEGIVNTNDYQYYSYIVNSSSSRYVRIYSDDQYTTKVGRVCIDDILIAEPLAATLSMSNLVITPSIPLYTNTVHITADIYKLFLAPSNITLTAYYATATTYAALSSATPIPLGMGVISNKPTVPGQWYRYQTTNAVPAFPTDTFVKYYVRASYAGYQAASTSPRTLSTFTTYPPWYAPMDQVYTNGFAYYVSYSCPTGSVWINEINAWDYNGFFDVFTNEFVEISGKAGTDIKNWSLDIYQDFEQVSEATYVGTYTFTNATVLSNASNGYGFWVLGTTNISPVHQLLTIEIDEGYGGIGTQLLPYAGGLTLKRSWGAAEQSVSFNTTLPGFDNGGNDGSMYPNGGGLSLQGTGTTYNAFGWAELPTTTPGRINNSQSFPLSIPDVSIYGFWINTNVWIVCSKSAGWHAIPWSSTNLMSSNSWTVIPAFNRTASGTNDLLNFNRSTNSSAYFYKVVATNAP